MRAEFIPSAVNASASIYFFWFFTENWGIDRKRVDKRSMKDF